MEDAKKAAYGEVIDLLVKDELDYKGICITLAKNAPEIFLEVIRAAVPNKDAVIEQHMIKFIRDNPGQKINAIKEHRGLTGMGLKESKDYIDDLMLREPTISGDTVSLGDLIAKMHLPEHFPTIRNGSSVSKYPDMETF